MKLSQEQAETFSSFTSTHAGQQLLRYLGEVAELENRALIGARENVYVRQGRVQMVTQLLEIIIGSESAARAFEQPKT